LGRYRPRSIRTGSPGLPWDLVFKGSGIWRACRWHIRARRRPPSGWSWPDWWQEIEAVCFARALEALHQFDLARGVPLAAFLHTQVHYALSERYRQEERFAAHCHGDFGAPRESADHEESNAAAEGVTAWLALQALPDDERRLLERLVLEDESEARLASELGVNQSTISRRKQKLLKSLRSALEIKREKTESDHA
jgi:RNA polymerase sigma factor (sigma-70 family)